MKATIFRVGCICCILFLSGTTMAQLDDTFFEKAYKAESKGEYKTALLYYDLAIASNPNNEIYYIARGDLISSLQETKKASIILASMNPFLEAQKNYTTALEIRPDSYLAYMRRGMLYLNNNDLGSARADFDLAVKNAFYVGDMIYARGLRGKTRFKQNEVDGALLDIEKALELDSTSAYLLNELGFIYMQTNVLDEAEKCYNKILKHHPENLIAFSNLGFLEIKRGNFISAVAIFNEAIEVQPSREILYCNRALAYHFLGEAGEAAADIAYSLKLNENNSFAYYVAALIEIEREDKESACKALHKAKALGYTLHYDQQVLKLLMENCIEVNKHK